MMMQRRGLAVGLFVTGLVLAAAFVPAASAHGAANVRGIDTRLVLDDDGENGYLPDSCTPEPTPATCPLSSGAADLLAFDVREARDGGGAPILWFRLAYQGLDDVVAGRSFHIVFQAD